MTQSVTVQETDDEFEIVVRPQLPEGFYCEYPVPSPTTRCRILVRASVPPSELDRRCYDEQKVICETMYIRDLIC